MKAILVIDVDKADVGREVNYISVQGGGMSYIVGTMGEDVRLIPLPKKRKILADTDPFWQGVNYGWNVCLDKITGVTE